MNDNWLWTWRVPDEPAVVMLINAIDLVPLLVSVRAWIIRFFVRFIFILVLLMLVMTWHRDKGRVTGWSPLMEKERLTLPEHRNSPPLFIWGSCCSIFNIPCSIIWIIVLSFCFFFLHFFWPLHCLSLFELRFWFHFWYIRTFLTNNSTILCIKYYLAWVSICAIERIIPLRPSSNATIHYISKKKYQKQYIHTETARKWSS
jgi:hypothetical protein